MIFLLTSIIFSAISCSQIILIYGTLNVSDVLSTTSVSDKESCSELCLSEVNCVSLFFIPSSGSCSIYSMYQVLSYQKNDVSENVVGIKTNSSSSTCSSSFSDINLSGDVNGIAYQFSPDSSFSYQTCPEEYKQFTRTRGIWCMKLHNFSTPTPRDFSYCSQQSAYPTGFDNDDEISFITSEILSLSLLQRNIGIDGHRKSSCYNSTTTWCDDFEWSNNYTNYPTLINWAANDPSRRDGSILENDLGIWMKDESTLVDIFGDIANTTNIHGFVCGVPLGNWNFD